MLFFLNFIISFICSFYLMSEFGWKAVLVALTWVTLSNIGLALSLSGV